MEQNKRHAHHWLRAGQRGPDSTVHGPIRPTRSTTLFTRCASPHHIVNMTLKLDAPNSSAPLHATPCHLACMYSMRHLLLPDSARVCALIFFTYVCCMNEGSCTARQGRVCEMWELLRRAYRKLCPSRSVLQASNMYCRTCWMDHWGGR